MSQKLWCPEMGDYSAVGKDLDTVQNTVILALYSSTFDLKLNNEYEVSSLIWGYL